MQFKIAYEKANTLYLRGDYFEAIRSFEEAIAAEPDDPSGYYGLGLVYAKLSDWDEAIKQNKRAVGLKRDLFEAHMNLGQCYSKLAARTGEKDYWKLARDAHARAFEIKPTSTAALHSLAFDEWKARNEQAAAQHLEQLIVMDPVNMQARQLLASIYLLRARLPDAWRALMGRASP